MLSGLKGTLVSHSYADRRLFQDLAGHLGEATARAAHARFVRWWQRDARQLGPASGLRALWDAAAVSLADQLGFTIGHAENHQHLRIGRVHGAHVSMAIVAAHWNVSLDGLWQRAVRQAIALKVEWALCTNARQVRLVQVRRCYSRAHLEFELERVAESRATFDVLWALLRRDAFDAQGGTPVLVRAIVASAAHERGVSRSLKLGVIEAVEQLLRGFGRCRPGDADRLFAEALTVVYRMLFLMFAEARRLVPVWHPIYRDGYTMEALRDAAERPGTARGIWNAIQAISRMAHKGCSAGTLHVPPFNGRLFSPVESPLADACDVEDETVQKALVALSTAPEKKRRTRIDYGDLGVEQLGAVYETLLDYSPERSSGASTALTLVRGSDRKATASFYTPRAITDYVVRRTLHPLVESAAASDILELRIVDPAMGSGAFLVAACQYLARAYERALVREGQAHEGDLDERDRAAFRRLVAQRCLFGVDLNPTAVHLARLSLWLATLAAEKPLTFLDHRLACGNSVLGAAPDDLLRQPPASRPRAARPTAATPLFADAEFETLIARAVAERRWLAETADDTAAIVHEKERRLAQLRQGARWKAAADLWCACLMWPDARTAPDAATFAALSDVTAGRPSSLPPHTTAPLLERAAAVVRTERFFHWKLEFAEAFFDEAGVARSNGGFDAVIGNPPWDLLPALRRDRHFIRHAGIYRFQGAGRLNRYQLFVERALQLVRRGGRVGLVLPGGFATDHTAAPLRRRLFAHADVEAITGFDNRKGIFPIHRSVRFLVCTATAGEPTGRIACRFGIDALEELESIPDGGALTSVPNPLTLTPAFIERVSGERLALPDVRTPGDLAVLEHIVHTAPPLSAPNGWRATFGRELNATDDRAHFSRDPTGLPVLEGKDIEPYQVDVAGARQWIAEPSARQLLPGSPYKRARLAYRDVACPTNKLSLIAAVLPAGVVSTHSLFCLKTPLSVSTQAVLCALLNSYVANYLVRLVMTTHLGSTTVEALRVPVVARESSAFAELGDLARALARRTTPSDAARVQALAAHAYRLNETHYTRVLETFPLVDPRDRSRAFDEFARLRAADHGSLLV